MMFKRATILLPAFAVVFLLTIFTACRQKKEDMPEPEQGEVPVNDNYLITKISISGVSEDSLVYANERIIEQWTTTSNGFKRTNKYFYNSDGQLASAAYNLTGIYNIRDSLVWFAKEVITYSTYYKSDDIIDTYDTTLFKIDAFDRMIRYRKTDTVGVAPNRSSNFWEGAFTNNNLTESRWFHYYESYPNESYDSRVTLAYGRLRNPLAKYLIGNPWLSVEYLSNIGPYIFSEFNMTKIKDKNGKVITTATATKFPGTENILTQTIQEGNNTKIVTYSYVPKP